MKKFFRDFLKEFGLVVFVVAAGFALLLSSYSTNEKWNYSHGGEQAVVVLDSVDADTESGLSTEQSGPRIYRRAVSLDGQWTFLSGEVISEVARRTDRGALGESFVRLQRPGPIAGTIDLLPSLKLATGLDPSALWVEAAAFSQDGRWLVTSVVVDRPSVYREGVVHLWDVRSGQFSKQLGGRRTLADELAFSPNGKLLAVSEVYEGQTISLLDVESGRDVWSYRIQLESLQPVTLAMGFSPDGRYLLVGGSASSDQDLKTWLRVVQVRTGTAKSYDHLFQEGWTDRATLKEFRFNSNGRTADIVREYPGGGTETVRIRLR